MKAWRPEGWENPYPDLTEEAITEKYLIQAMEDPKTDYMKFEAGADMMLKALSEGIEKELDGREEDMIACEDYKGGWLDCRHWVLSLLKE